jgi:hypothetical protein
MRGGPERGSSARSGPTLLIDPVEDGGGIDQHRTVVQHQRGDAPQRIRRPHGVEIAEHRTGVVFIGKAQHGERNRHPAGIGGVIVADEDHARSMPHGPRAHKPRD